MPDGPITHLSAAEHGWRTEAIYGGPHGAILSTLNDGPVRSTMIIQGVTGCTRFEELPGFGVMIELTDSYGGVHQLTLFGLTLAMMEQQSDAS